VYPVALRDEIRTRVKHNCQLQPAFSSLHGGRIRSPLVMGLTYAQVALQQMCRSMSSLLTFRRDPSMAWTPSCESSLTQETSEPGASHNACLGPSIPPESLDCHRLIDWPGKPVVRLGLSGHQLGCAAWVSLSTRVIPTLGTLKHTAHGRDALLMLVLSKQVLSDCWPPEKMPTAFLKLSRS